MIELPEFHQFLSIMGFSGVRISSVNDFVKMIRLDLAHVPLQLFDANYIAGKGHLLFATLSALTAFQQNRSLSERLEVEILLYVSGQRQIRRAIEMVGLKPDTSKIVLLFISSNREDVHSIKEAIIERIPGKRDDQVVGYGEEKIKGLIKTFNITINELNAVHTKEKSLWEAIVGIVIEKSVLLAIQR